MTRTPLTWQSADLASDHALNSFLIEENRLLRARLEEKGRIEADPALHERLGREIERRKHLAGQLDTARARNRELRAELEAARNRTQRAGSESGGSP